MTHRHAAVSSAEAREGQKLSGAPRCQSAEMRGGRYDHRHLAQQRTIAEQKRRLKEQQDIISELQERQKILELRQEAEKAEQLAVQLKPFPSQSVFKTRYRLWHLSHDRKYVNVKEIQRKGSLADKVFMFFTVTDRKVNAAPVVQPPKSMTVIWLALILHCEVRFTYIRNHTHTHTPAGADS